MYQGYSGAGFPSASQQYSYSQIYSQNYNNANQVQNSQASVPQGSASDPALPSSSFLQDNTLEDDNAFESNSVTQTEVMPAEAPPPDPPENPFGESRKKPNEEIDPAQLAKIVEECSKTGVETVENFRKCTEDYSYSITSHHAQFGSDKCDFEPEFVCR